MKIRLQSAERCARAAKSLKKSLSENGVETRLSTCQNALGRMLGYRNWQELSSAHREPVKQSGDDGKPSVDMRDRVAGIAQREFGLDRAVASALADSLLPVIAPKGVCVANPDAQLLAAARHRLIEAVLPHGFVGCDPHAVETPGRKPFAVLRFRDLVVSAWYRGFSQSPALPGGARPLRIVAVAEDAKGARVGVLEGIAACNAAGNAAPPSAEFPGEIRPYANDVKLAGAWTLADALMDHDPFAAGEMMHGLTHNFYAVDSINSPPGIDGVLLLSTWERDFARSPNGTGGAMIYAVLLALRLGGFGAGAVMVPVRLPQFPGDLPVDQAMIQVAEEHVAIRVADLAHWELEYEVAMPSPIAIPLFVSYDARRRDDGEAPATPTHPEEPRPWRSIDPKLESAFGECSRMAAAAAVDWDGLPRDLVGIEFLHYVGLRSREEYHIDLDRMLLTFRNGTLLQLPLYAVDRWLSRGTPPLALRNVQGGLVRRNPHTGRMATADMLDVICTNAMRALRPVPDPTGDGGEWPRVLARRTAET